ncbi:MAG: RNHCP domain-containing protein [Alphaproteobacteria bacterium]|nr:RNHCP domain-containing protein [Alphaproteobacteria bacterium]
MKKFTRRIENFTCAHCGADVLGNGYTNHCPNCLWSRHVDNTPGDRQSTCGGMMRPISVAPDKDGYIITHKCEKCGKTIRQHSAPDDDIDTIISISTNPDFIFGK